MIDWPLAIAAFAHTLVFVYWLGGDLGAFYASTILTDARQPTAARIAAARVLANIDMAPRTALILAAPTGVTLAQMSHWLAWPIAAVIGIWFVALVWLAVAWVVHLRHAPPQSWLRRLDLATRWIVIAALLATAFSGVAALPLFIQLKFALLAAAIGCGLAIRATLAPFGHAFAALMRNGPDEDVNATISTCLARARPLVLLIWALLACAALLGLAKPL